MLFLVNLRGKKIRQYRYLKGKQSEADRQQTMEQHPELLRKTMGPADIHTLRLSFITEASLWYSSNHNTYISTSQLSFIKTNKQNLGRTRHYKYKWKSWWSCLLVGIQQESLRHSLSSSPSYVQIQGIHTFWDVFPGAVAANYHQLSGLWQQEFFSLLQFWRPEAKASVGPCSHPRPWGNILSCLFQFPWLLAFLRLHLWGASLVTCASLCISNFPPPFSCKNTHHWGPPG